MIHRILALSVGAAVSLVTMERAALACSPPSCSQDLVTIAGDVPASAIAFPFVEGTLVDGRPKPGSTFRLEDPTGSEVPWITKADPWWPSGSLLTPIALTSRSGYALLHNEACSQGSGPTGNNLKRLFDVVPAVDLPSSAGALGGSGREVGPRSVSSFSGSCVSMIDVVAIDLRITPTPELLAYAPIAGFKTSVDGVESGSTYYGLGKVDGSGIVVKTLHAACGLRSPSDDNGVTLGMHTISVRAHVAGATADPPATSAAIEFSCTDPRLDADASVNGGHDAGDTVTPDGSPPVHGDHAGELGATSGCACTTARSRDEAGACEPAILVAGLGLVVARARRRSPRGR